MELTELRQELNDINAEMTRLFCRRMELSKQVGLYKKEHGLPVLDRAREREILAEATKQAGPALARYARVFFQNLFDLSRSYQNSIGVENAPLVVEIKEAMKAAEAPGRHVLPAGGLVACQGVEGAYSQLAADKLFPMGDILYFRSFEGVFQAVEKGLCQYGVLPIENSSYGSVNEVYDLMRHFHFHIVRSLKLRVDHNLLAKPGTRFEDVKEIFSHEQALGQCSEYLAKYPALKVTVCENTAAAAKMVAESPRGDIAAISSHNCAGLYGLAVLEDRLQNSENNYTRFICVSKELEIYPGADRISLLFSVPHQPGSLYEMIAKFSALGLNLTKLESRPIPGRDFEFLFYFDLEATVWSEDVMRLLAELSSTGELFVFLGCYSEQ